MRANNLFAKHSLSCKLRIQEITLKSLLSNYKIRKDKLKYHQWDKEGYPINPSMSSLLLLV